MHSWTRRVWVSAFCAAGLAAATVGPALAKTAPADPTEDRPASCAVAPAGDAHCNAHVRSTKRTGKPAATTSYSGGYAPAD